MCHKNKYKIFIVRFPHRTIKHFLSFIGHVRILHQNLKFSLTDMRRAIGTSIRSATCELRKVERHRLVLSDLQHNEEPENGEDLHDQDDTMEDASDDGQEGLNEDSDIDEAENDDDDEDDEEGENRKGCVFIDDEVEDSDE